MTPGLAKATVLATVLFAGVAAGALVAGDDPAGPTRAAEGHSHRTQANPPDPDPIRLGPQGRHPQFVVECSPSHVAADDPILFRDQPGASHLHQFFGSRDTDAASTGESLLGTATTCDNAADTAAYWVPVLFDGDETVAPETLVAYYRTGIGIEPSEVRPWPLGLEMLAGDPGAESHQSIGVVGWTCGSSDHLTVRPRSCTPRAPLTLRLTFPDCWDGRNTASEDHRSHVAYSADGACPGTHPVPIVQLILAVRYAFHGDVGSLRLASGSILTGHGDVLNGWSRDELAHLTDLCLRRSEICGISSNRTDV